MKIVALFFILLLAGIYFYFVSSNGSRVEQKMEVKTEESITDIEENDYVDAEDPIVMKETDISEQVSEKIPIFFNKSYFLNYEDSSYPKEMTLYDRDGIKVSSFLIDPPSRTNYRNFGFKNLIAMPINELNYPPGTPNFPDKIFAQFTFFDLEKGDRNDISFPKEIGVDTTDSGFNVSNNLRYMAWSNSHGIIHFFDRETKVLDKFEVSEEVYSGKNDCNNYAKNRPYNQNDPFDKSGLPGCHYGQVYLTDDSVVYGSNRYPRSVYIRDIVSEETKSFDGQLQDVLNGRYVVYSLPHKVNNGSSYYLLDTKNYSESLLFYSDEVGEDKVLDFRMSCDQNNLYFMSRDFHPTLESSDTAVFKYELKSNNLDKIFEEINEVYSLSKILGINDDQNFLYLQYFDGVRKLNIQNGEVTKFLNISMDEYVPSCN